MNVLALSLILGSVGPWLLMIPCYLSLHRWQRKKWERRRDAINALRIQRVADRGIVELPGRLRRYDTAALDLAMDECNQQIRIFSSFWPITKKVDVAVDEEEEQRRPNQTRSAKEALEEDLKMQMKAE